jgi:thioredoxin-dependent peroxiredoxin
LELKAHVVLVYPGQAAELKQRAAEFLHGEKLPEPFVLALDPDFKFTLLYGLRWDAPNETAYPSTFVVDGGRKVKFRKVSKTHGDRAEVEDVLAALRKE